MLRNTGEDGETTRWGRKRRERGKMCLGVPGMHGEVEKEREGKDVFRRAGHAWGGGGGMERGLGVLV